ncbi:hypothetical protein FQR65_LT08431 [Abscondita terminalis]|nr:hypothetical protein FQR65_LT08431 [Abscondita terminalis]
MLVIKETEVNFLGDSIFRRLLTDVLKRRTNIMITVDGKSKLSQQLAIGGQTIAQLQKRVARVKNSTLSYSLARHIYVFIGGNNVLKNHKCHQMVNQFQHLMGTLKAMQHITQMVIITLPRFPVASEQQLLTITKFNRHLRRLRSHRIRIVDIEIEFGRQHFERDGIHLNCEGLEILWERMQEQN